jgi:uncharacterized protein
MFGTDGCALIGMVHLLPLPGSPRWEGNLQAIKDRAQRDTEKLLEGGCHGVLVENMGDLPYLKGHVAEETLCAMTLITQSVVEFGAPVGVQVLAAANAQALAIATTTGARFIRVEGFAYAHVADEGWIDACAGPLLRKRTALGSQVQIWADIQKKHSAHAVTADLSIQDLAEGATFSGADVLVVTGPATGSAARVQDVVHAKTSGRPIAVGSGINSSNVSEFGDIASALIVGSHLKTEGNWRNPVDIERVRDLANRVR